MYLPGWESPPFAGGSLVYGLSLAHDEDSARQREDFVSFHTRVVFARARKA
jgi:hypothetical protein